MIDRAVQALAEPAARTAGLRLDVNVSGRSLEDPELGQWILTALGVGYAQGFHLGRPRPLDELLSSLSQHGSPQERP